MKTLLGTTGYMAPEISLDGKDEYSSKVDIFACMFSDFLKNIIIIIVRLKCSI